MKLSDKELKILSIFIATMGIFLIGSGITSIGMNAFGKPSGNTQYESITVLAAVVSGFSVTLATQ